MRLRSICLIVVLIILAVGVGTVDGVKINRPATFFKKLNDRDHWYLFYEWSFVKPE